MSESETKETTRYMHWFAQAAFNTIAIVGLSTQLDGNLSDQETEIKWSMSAMIITLVFSALAVLAHVLPKGKFVGTPVEGGLSLLTLALWAAAMPTIMKPAHEIAQTKAGTVNNANLYFFSWGALIAAMYTFVHYMREVKGMGTSSGGKNTEFKPLGWAGLMAASFVTMAAAARLFKSAQCKDLSGVAFCRRVDYAISIGVISGIVAFVWMFVGSKVPAIVDSICAATLMVGWTFAIGYITFGDVNMAPARNIGNLYFSTWAGFITSCLLMAGSIGVVTSKCGVGADEETAAEEAKPDDKDEEPKADEENAAAEENAAEAE